MIQLALYNVVKATTTIVSEVCTHTGWLCSARLRAEQTVLFFGSLRGATDSTGRFGASTVRVNGDFRADPIGVLTLVSVVDLRFSETGHQISRCN